MVTAVTKSSLTDFSVKCSLRPLTVWKNMSDLDTNGLQRYHGLGKSVGAIKLLLCLVLHKNKFSVVGSFVSLSVCILNAQSL